MSAAMVRKPFRPTRRSPSLKPTRSGIRRALLLVPLLAVAGALLDPSLIRPFGPLAAQAERVSTRFTPCRGGGSPACVVDGDTFKLGQRSIRVTGIDAPELANPRCAEEAALARRSADRLLVMLNDGSFDMIAHRLQRQDRHGRDLMVLERNGESIGDRMIAEGLAHRYIGSKRSWC